MIDLGEETRDFVEEIGLGLVSGKVVARPLRIDRASVFVFMAIGDDPSSFFRSLSRVWYDSDSWRVSGAMTFSDGSIAFRGNEVGEPYWRHFQVGQ